ncbi:MAG: hypothetical protein LBC40_05900 [Dysgonamonadaceae bacterium]|nr:hypothetical protein [Dysgonamonadaceae bacterium]
MNDNIGGFSRIEMAALSQISNMYISDTVSVILKSMEQWAALPFQTGTPRIEAVPEDTDAGIIYNMSVELYIPRQYMNCDVTSALQMAGFYNAVIRYTTNNRETFILGSIDYPLRLTGQTVHPGTAGGFSAYKLLLTGKSLCPQLPVSL